MNIDIDKLSSYSHAELEKEKMIFDIAKVLHDMEMDKEKFATERMERQAQLKAEDEERKARIAKMQAEIDETNKRTKYYPWTAIVVALIALAGGIIGSLVTAFINLN